MKRISIMILLFFCLFGLQAQVKGDARFGKITPSDFTVSSPLIDSNSNAVILSDVGSTEFVGNTNGDFTLVFKEHKRILLRNRNGFEAATIKIPVYLGRQFVLEEKFEDFEATTYNIENGQVSTTRIDKSAVFAEKADRDHSVRKFTFPNIKAGCIIEYQYTIKSPFYQHLRSWNFQDVYPCLWSEYNVVIPHMFKYIITRKGYLPFTIDTTKKMFKSYTIVQRATESGASDEAYQVSGDAIAASWAIKNIPAFKSESYTSASINYINRIQFDLREIEFSSSNTRRIIKNWDATAVDLMKDPDFGLPLTEINGWISDIMKEIGKTSSNQEKAKKIFEYVRNNFKCNSYDALWLSQPLKKTFQTKSGNVIDINLLLTAIFINQGFSAQPVLLSTRDNGYANEVAALLHQYNYAISRVKVDDDFFLLDASHSRLGFGKLVENTYNNFGKVIDDKSPLTVYLYPDSLEETKTTNLFVSNGDNGGIEASYNSNLGYIESLKLRNRLAGMKVEDYFKEIMKSYPSDIKISNIVIDSLKQYDDPVSVSYDMKLDFGDQDLVYFNPMFNEAWKKNPFVSAERLYPVEMPFKIDEVFILLFEIPKGYKVDEMPKGARVKLNEKDGIFEYIIGMAGDKIQLRCRLKLEKTFFQPDDYATLRDFFGFIVKKEAEQIVFKKIK